MSVSDVSAYGLISVICNTKLYNSFVRYERSNMKKQGQKGASKLVSKDASLVAKNVGRKELKNKELVNKLLGDRIRHFRKEKGYTSLYDFAYAHDISRTQYARFEQGTNMTFHNMLLVVTALEITLSQLLESFEDDLSKGEK